MKSARIIVIILFVMALAAGVMLQRSAIAQATTNLRIIAPANGAKITTDFVQVRYELINSAADASGMPTFQLQLDGNDPVQTVSHSYTFTGLAPGLHTVLIELVDANNTPIAGSINAVQFMVLQPTPASRPQGARLAPPPFRTAKPVGTAPVMRAGFSGSSADESLPDSAGGLPLLSVVGFGVLLGGIISALRTR